MYDDTEYVSSINVLMLVTGIPDAGVLHLTALILDDAGNYKMMLVTTKRCW